MTWLILILVLAMVIGPVMYLLPSDKDKRLTDLRLAARKAGLTVKITSVPKLDPTAEERVSASGKVLDPKIPCASYELPLSRPLRKPGEFCLLKIPGNATVPVTEVRPGWAIAGDAANPFWKAFAGRTEALKQLDGCLERLPTDVLAFGCTHRTVACYWREKTDESAAAVDTVKSALSMVAIPLLDWFETAPEGNSNDS